jgi:hypothetical protein
MPFASIGAALGISAGTAALGAAGIGGALLSANASSDAADTAANASNRASDASIGEQRRQFDINQANQQPFLTGGTNAFNRLSRGFDPGGEFTGNLSSADFLANKDPGYAFRMDEGMKALDRTAAARGGMLSGGALRGAQQFGQGLASQEYQNAFNRFQVNRGNMLQPLQSLAGVGQTTANTLGAAGANMASNVGNAMMSNAGNVGNAALSAAGQQNSAYGGAANVLGRMYGNQQRPQQQLGRTPPYADSGGYNVLNEMYDPYQ